VLEIPDANQKKQLLNYYQKNHHHLSAWEPKRDPDFYTESYFNKRIKDCNSEFQKLESVRLCLNDTTTGEIIGICNFTKIINSRCFIGYSINKDHEGKGLMKQTLNNAMNYMFNVQRLNCIQAVCLPNNKRSRNLLKIVGFTEGGLLKNYLEINGNLEDHILYSLQK